MLWINYCFQLLSGFRAVSKGEVALRILGKVLLFCPIFLLGCASSHESTTSSFFLSRNVVEQSGQYGEGAQIRFAMGEDVRLKAEFCERIQQASSSGTS
jgi:hypothetical protein